VGGAGSKLQPAGNAIHTDMTSAAGLIQAPRTPPHHPPLGNVAGRPTQAPLPAFVFVIPEGNLRLFDPDEKKPRKILKRLDPISKI
jgi:hypothetical protein